MKYGLLYPIICSVGNNTLAFNQPIGGKITDIHSLKTRRL